MEKMEERLNQTLLRQLVTEVKELSEKVDRLNGIGTVYQNNQPDNKTNPVDKPSQIYSGRVVTKQFDKLYDKIDSGLINSKQEEFGRALYDYYSNKNFLSTKQFDALNKLVQ